MNFEIVKHYYLILHSFFGIVFSKSQQLKVNSHTKLRFSKDCQSKVLLGKVQNWYTSGKN